jgi:chromosome segregation ATPase
MTATSLKDFAMYVALCIRNTAESLESLQPHLKDFADSLRDHSRDLESAAQDEGQLLVRIAELEADAVQEQSQIEEINRNLDSCLEMAKSMAIEAKKAQSLATFPMQYDPFSFANAMQAAIATLPSPVHDGEEQP